MRRVFTLFLSVVLLAGLLCGCQTEDKPYVPTGNGLTWDEETKPTDPVITEQSLSLAYYPNRSLNPYTCSDYTNRALFSLVYQGLFTVGKDNGVYPVLCHRYSRSWDMKTYTFYLAQATFSDGEALTAEDVVASLNGAKESPVYQGRFGYVDTITANEEGAVIVKLTTPYENLPILLDIPIFKAKEVSAECPLGTGAYFYKETEGKLSLHRRTDWWCQASLPVTAQTIKLTVGENPAQLRDEFEFHDLSMVCADPGSETYVDFHSDYELWDCENGIFLYLAVNRYSEVFSETTVRQALTWAIDREGLVEDYYRGFASGVYLPALESSPYYSQSLVADYGFNPDKLAQAVTDNQLTEQSAVLLVNKDDGIRLRAARSIAVTLSQCGLKVTTSELETEDYLTALEEGAFDLYLGQTKLSPNMDLTAFFAEEGSLSYGNLSDPALHSLCMDALANAGNYYNLHKRILEEGLLCPILMRTYALFAQRGAFTELNPARDEIFFYHLGRTMDDAFITEE